MANVRQVRTAPSGAIVRELQVCDGEPTIAGTHVPVQSVMVSYQS